MKFGIREVITIVITTIIFVIFERMQYVAVGPDALPRGLFDWADVSNLVVTIAAAMFGPVVGVISAASGMIFSSVLFEGHIDYILVVVVTVYSLLIGLFFGKLNILEGKFTRLALVDYNVIQIMANLFSVILLFPMLLFITGKANLLDVIQGAVSEMAGGIILNAVAGTPILYLTSLIEKKSRYLWSNK